MSNRVTRVVRTWLNTNREGGTPPLLGATAINGDHDAYQGVAADIVANLRLDPHDDLPHGDYLHAVGIASPRIEFARMGSPAVP